ncbi:hypothetical protein EV426DRAFT_669818 [Tirmania nivea]|nr:hypothetical protein EV426DRAFT_669818 [Tirmania nivea]
MFVLTHLLYLAFRFPTVGELPYWRGNFLFNPPVEHNFPSILSIDAPPAILTLDGPPPPTFLHPIVVEEPAYHMTLGGEVFLPPSYDYCQVFGCFLVACFFFLMLWQFSQELPRRNRHYCQRGSQTRLMDAEAQARKLERKLNARDLEVLELRAHLSEAAAKAEYMSAEVELTSYRLVDAVTAHKVALASSRRLQRIAQHNITHYQRCLEDLVEGTLDLAKQRNALDIERRKLRVEVTRLRQQRQERLHRHLELFANVKTLSEEAMEKAVRLEHQLAVRNDEISILRMSEELLQLKVEITEQRLAAYKDSNSHALRREELAPNHASASPAATLAPLAPANTIPVAVSPEPVVPPAIDPVLIALPPVVPDSAAAIPASLAMTPVLRGIVAPARALPTPFGSTTATRHMRVASPAIPGPPITPVRSPPTLVRPGGLQASTAASERRVRQVRTSPVIVPAEWVHLTSPKVILGGRR